jgi:hypothetical protein
MSKSYLIHTVRHPGMSVELADGLGVGSATAITKTGEDKTVAVESGSGKLIGKKSYLVGACKKNTLMF